MMVPYTLKKFDLRDKNYGFSGVKIYEDCDIYVSLGSENSYNHDREVVNVDFEKIGIEVITFDLIDEAKELEVDPGMKHEFINKVFKLIKFDYALVMEIATSAYEQGSNAGKEQLQIDLRTLLGSR